MKILGFFKTFVIPHLMVRYKMMNIIISVCIFVISSFLLAIPISQNKFLNEKSIIDNPNYDVLLEIPNQPSINNVIASIVNKECYVSEGKELKCDNLGVNISNFERDFSFVVDGITKRVHIVIDIFDIEAVYLEKDGAKVYYDPVLKFTTANYPVVENVENYLIILASDALYFQAHPHGTNELGIYHHDRKLTTSVSKIFYQNNIPDFKFAIENPSTNGYKIGEYLHEQIIIGNANTIKLQSFSFTFLVGVCFTLITVIILWVFFRRNGRIKLLREYYNIAAISSIPVTALFFILLWFLPILMNVYIYIFSLFYLISLYIINSSEELV